MGDEHICLHNDRLSFRCPAPALNLEGSPKDIADRLKDLLRQDGVTSALIDLGWKYIMFGAINRMELRFDRSQTNVFRSGMAIDTVAVKDLCGIFRYL